MPYLIALKHELCCRQGTKCMCGHRHPTPLLSTSTPTCSPCQHSPCSPCQCPPPPLLTLSMPPLLAMSMPPLLTVSTSPPARCCIDTLLLVASMPPGSCTVCRHTWPLHATLMPPASACHVDTPSPCTHVSSVCFLLLFFANNPASMLPSSAHCIDALTAYTSAPPFARCVGTSPYSLHRCPLDPAHCVDAPGPCMPRRCPQPLCLCKFQFFFYILFLLIILLQYSQPLLASTPSLPMPLPLLLLAASTLPPARCIIAPPARCADTTPFSLH
jgi:hypothetical protein